MKIENFGVEQWMNTYENDCEYNLAETCVDSLTVNELLELSGEKEAFLQRLQNLHLTYGAIEGSAELKAAIATLYTNQQAENIVVTHGGIGANALVMLTLVNPGDTTISVKPTYQQHYSIPASIGAAVKILNLREENAFLPDLNELRALAKNGAKLININNPNNPTGSVMPPDMLQEIVEIAREAGAWLLCDEVYRGLNHTGSGFSPSVADLYEKGISTSSMSKTFSLAGLRLGWVAAPRSLIEAVNHQRDYHVISVSRIDDLFATLALQNKDKILARSRSLAATNSAILHEWVAAQPKVSYVQPQGGTIALLRLQIPMGTEDFCRNLQNDTGVMLLPGECLAMPGTVRIGYCCKTSVLQEGLARTAAYLAAMQ